MLACFMYETAEGELCNRWLFSYSMTSTSYTFFPSSVIAPSFQVLEASDASIAFHKFTLAPYYYLL
jgi:hypothetical protein